MDHLKVGENLLFDVVVVQHYLDLPLTGHFEQEALNDLEGKSLNTVVLEAEVRDDLL